VTLAIVLSLATAAAAATPAMAAVILSETGVHGPYVVPDQVDPSIPGARCGYGAETVSGDAFFKWMKFRKPDVYARDTGDGVQRQKVKLVYEIQKNIGPGWQTVARSKQTARAHETMPADFVPHKLFFAGGAGDELRGVVTIKWLRAGAVEGTVRLRLEEYSVKWTVGTPDFTFQDVCSGSAD
jgi:hypothetical protein